MTKGSIDPGFGFNPYHWHTAALSGMVRDAIDSQITDLATIRVSNASPEDCQERLLEKLASSSVLRNDDVADSSRIAALIYELSTESEAVREKELEENLTALQELQEHLRLERYTEVASKLRDAVDALKLQDLPPADDVDDAKAAEDFISLLQLLAQRFEAMEKY